MPANRMYQGEALDMIVGDMAAELVPAPRAARIAAIRAGPESMMLRESWCYAPSGRHNVATTLVPGEVDAHFIADLCAADERLDIPNLFPVDRRPTSQILADIAKTVADAQSVLADQDRAMRQVVGELLVRLGQELAGGK
jgi:hypothetical protein